jgi:hypothetical protein
MAVQLLRELIAVRVRCTVVIVSQVLAAIIKRGTGIPGRPLDGGQAADDRDD